jgi:transcriptional antiterminator/mannitol/fructose-specific phosphotransferase system IIA component (Ntr-type)
MNLLTKRQRDILALLVKEQEFVTVKKIAAAFAVAERTIRYDLEWIENGLKEKNIKLVKKPQFGVKIDFLESGIRRESILSELNQIYQRVLSVAERQFFILLYLLMEHKEITMQQIADYLNVSKNTIVADIEAVDNLLGTSGLKLERKAHYGIYLAGSEKNIRSFYIKKILEGLERKYITEEDLILLMKQISSVPVLRTIDDIESSLNVIFSDLSKQELYVALLVAIYRIYIGKFVEAGESGGESNRVYRKINGLYQDFATANHIQIPQSEFEYIRRIFMGAKIASNMPGVAPPFAKADAEVSNICKSIVEEARRYLGLDLHNDPELVNGLRTHLTTTIHRLRNNLSVSNPLTQQIQFQMPFIFEMSKKIMIKYEARIGMTVPDEEIAYIAMYFGAAFERSLSSGFMPKAMVVCGSGVATSGLLITRLKIMLPELKLIGPVPADKIPEMLASHEVDFIITTAPVKASGRDVVLVNPLLDNDDLSKIKTFIFRYTSKKQLQYLSKCNIPENDEDWTLANLLPPSVINLNMECKDWQQAIWRCSQPLLENGSITERYVNAMVKAVIDYGPYMVFIPEIAMTHAAPENGLIKECLSLTTLKTPLYFGDRNKELVKIIIVFGTLDHQLESLHRIVKIFEKEGNIEAIKNAHIYEEIMNLSGR